MCRRIVSTFIFVVFSACAQSGDQDSGTNPGPVPPAQNVPPSATAVSLGAGPFTASHAIYAEVTGVADTNGDPITLRYAWRIDGTPVKGAAGPALPPEHFSRGQRVTCSVIPFDGKVAGAAVTSPTAAIENASPDLSAVMFLQTRVTVLDNLIAVPLAVDADGDPLHFVFRWYANSTIIPDAPLPILPAGSAAHGDAVFVEVEVNDDHGGSITLRSASLTVANTLPTVTMNGLGAGPFFVVSVLAPLGVTSADPDGDTVSLRYRWIKSASTLVGEAPTLAGAVLRKGDQVHLELTPFDGIDEGATVFSEAVTIVNTPPFVKAVTTSPASVTTDSVLTVDATVYDADGDATTAYYQWYVNFTPVFGQTGPSLSGAFFERSDTVVVAVQGDDGTGVGWPEASSPVEVANTPPQIAGVALSAGPYQETSIISVEGIGWLDPDGDPEDYVFFWQVGGILAGNGPAIGGESFAKGDTVFVDVIPVDAFSLGSSHRSATVTIVNNPPPQLAVTLAPAFTDGVLYAQHDAPFDPDASDSLEASYAWYVDGALVTGEEARSLPGVHFARGQTVQTVLRISDGATSTLSFSNAVTIPNKPPEAPEAGLMPAAATQTASLWVAITADGVDADGDPVHYIYEWTRNGVTQNYPADTTAIQAASIIPGDTWAVVIRSHDGIDAGDSLALTRKEPHRAGDLTAGFYHTCAVSAEGAVYCWGRNSSGQLGNGEMGSNADKNVPVPVIGLESGVAQVAAGNAHSCARTIAGSVWCWGDNYYGQVGDASGGTIRLTPTAPFGLPVTVSAISAGYNHTCAVTQAGAAYCWGSNLEGQIGVGTSGNLIPAPVPVTGLTSGVTAIAAGGAHTCALLSSGVIQCWGQNTSGQLGAGYASVRQTTPVTVTGILGTPMKIAAGYDFTCMVSDTGAGACWGSNAQHRLGAGTADAYRTTPAPFATATPIVRIAVGYSHACAVLAGGRGVCWGANGEGQLGNGEIAEYQDPATAVAGLTSGVSAMAAGGYHTCASDGNGHLRCWGNLERGQLGTGRSLSPVTEPARVFAPSPMSDAVSAGYYHSCALDLRGGVLCWGKNEYGELGIGGTSGDHLVPVYATGLTAGVKAVQTGSIHTCALTQSGGVKCWGYNGNGQLGTNTGSKTVPTDVWGLTSGVRAISATSSNSCALLETGGVKCWGSNSNGQIGNGTIGGNQLIPAGVTGLSSGVSAIGVGDSHVCAVMEDGTVKCWGHNDGAQLGIGSAGGDYSTPQSAGGLANAVAVSGGSAHTCVLLADGGVRCWGYHGNGELGNGIYADYPYVVPAPQTPVGLSTGVIALDAGTNHTCAVLSMGGLVCWGANAMGRLGNGSTAHSWLPVGALGMDSGATAVSGGVGHTCAVKSGAAWCWGRNDRHQSGYLVLTPEPVVGFWLPASW